MRRFTESNDMKKFFVLFLILFQFSAIADVAVVTYNMAQLKKRGFDLVACTRRRVSLQIDAIFKNPASPIYADKNFVLLIQEAWTRRSFRALKRVAIEKGYSIFPDDHKDVKNSGQLIISNLPSVEFKSMPFTRDKYAKKGLVYARFDLGNGSTLGVINAHTAYSGKKGFSEEHRLHFSELVQAVKKLKDQTAHFVIGGDLNAGPDMGFKDTDFDASPWNDSFVIPMRSEGMRILESVGVTWDETNNALVRVPPLLLRLVNKYKHGYTRWDMTDSTLDHIIVQENADVSRHELAFDKKVPLNCGRRDGADGLVHLSDHYGVMAVIKTN